MVLAFPILLLDNGNNLPPASQVSSLYTCHPHLILRPPPQVFEQVTLRGPPYLRHGAKRLPP